jgi:hypothetical protein
MCIGLFTLSANKVSHRVTQPYIRVRWAGYMFQSFRTIIGFVYIYKELTMKM